MHSAKNNICQLKATAKPHTYKCIDMRRWTKKSAHICGCG